MSEMTPQEVRQYVVGLFSREAPAVTTDEFLNFVDKTVDYILHGQNITEEDVQEDA